MQTYMRNKWFIGVASMFIFVLALMLANSAYSTSIFTSPLVSGSSPAPLVLADTNAASFIGTLPATTLTGNSSGTLNRDAVQLVKENHMILSATAGTDATTYQNKYASCPNGGVVVGGVTTVGTYYVYTCIIPVASWYTDSNMISSPQYAFYANEAAGYVSWTNPLNNLIETVTTNSALGPIVVTFKIPSCFWQSDASGPNNNFYLFQNNSLDLGIGSAQTQVNGVAAPSTMSMSKPVPNVTCAVASSTGTFLTQPAGSSTSNNITITASFSTVETYATFSGNTVNGAGISSTQPSPLATSCSGKYQITASTPATVYLQCCTNGTANSMTPYMVSTGTTQTIKGLTSTPPIVKGTGCTGNTPM